MRYLVKARVLPGKEKELLQAIDQGTLGQGSIAGGEYLDNMQHARLMEDGTARWIEVCFCADPLNEERPYWEKFFELISIEDAHPRENCKDLSGKEPWACSDCSCTRNIEKRLRFAGKSFLEELRKTVS